MLDHRSLPNLGLRPNTSKFSGHSILPYLIVSDSVTWANVWVYDNNHVRDKSKVVIYDLSNSMWVYEFSNGVNWHSTVPANNSKYCGSIGHFNVSSYLSVDDGGYIGLAPWRNRRKTVVISTSDAVLVTASDGSSIGVNYDGEIITEVSDALIDVIDLEGTMLMLLPEDDYVFSVHTSASDRSGFIIMGDQETFAVESISAGDIFSISAGSIKYESSLHQTQPNIAIILEEESRSSAFSVQPNMSVGHQLIVQYKPETLDFRLSKTESMVFALDLDVITPGGVFRFRNDQIDQAADDTFIISLEELINDDDLLDIGIDTDQDGVIDQIIEIENQYDGELEEFNDIGAPERRPVIIFIIIGLIIAIVITAGLIILIRRNRKQQKRGSSRYPHRDRKSNTNNRDRNSRIRKKQAPSRPSRRHKNRDTRNNYNRRSR